MKHYIYYTNNGAKWVCIVVFIIALNEPQGTPLNKQGGAWGCYSLRELGAAGAKSYVPHFMLLSLIKVIQTYAPFPAAPVRYPRRTQ